MPRDKRISHERIIQAARKEFLSKGFEKASMRSIGSEAGMTQAALYRHFVSKEAMFSALVEPALIQLRKTFKESERIIADVSNNDISFGSLIIRNNSLMVKEFITSYRDAFRLVINCSQGTQYENFIPKVVRKQQEVTLRAIKKLKENGAVIRDISENELHIILSAYITAVFEPVVHDWPEEEAIACLDVIDEFFLPGWKKLFGY